MMKYLILLWPIVFISCDSNRTEEKLPDAQADSLLTTVPLITLTGEAIDWSLYEGKTVFINFWATWCVPCLKEMPSIQQAMEQLKETDIVFLFASDETTDQIEKFRAENPFKFHYVRIDNILSMNIMGLPTTMIYDASGKRVFSEMGSRNWSSKENIELLLDINKTK